MKNDIPQTSSVISCYAISQCLLLCSRKSEEKAGGRAGAPDSSAQPTGFPARDLLRARAGNSDKWQSMGSAPGKIPSRSSENSLSFMRVGGA